MRLAPRLPWRTPALTMSVVVPVYNVEPYLAAALDSILAQPLRGRLRDLEVVVVDDGSADASFEIAERYAATHPQVRVIRQENSGVSIARNRGIELCTGELLTFVDPDDVLPEDAWGPMLRTLEQTGSDFVVGKAERLEGQRRSVTPLMQRNHEERRLGVSIHEVPLMLADVFVWNKIFRREFWDAAGITFPPRTRYQDQPAMTHAFLAAKAFDVIPEVVYEWRMRADQSSATQVRRQLSNVTERMDTKRSTVALVEEEGSVALSRVLLTEVLPVDMWEHFRSAVVSGSDYRRVLREGLLDLWNEATVPFEQTHIPAQQRLMGWFVARDRWDDLASLLEWIDTHRPLPVVDGTLDHPWRGEPGLPVLPVSPAARL